MNLHLKNLYKSQTGSAIITVIVFSTIILFFISLIIIYNYQQNRLVIQHGQEIQAYYNTKSIVYQSLESYRKSLLAQDYSSITYTYNLSGKDSSLVTFEPWGLFIKAQARSTVGSKSCQRTFLLGNKGTGIFSNALVMGDISNPIVVAGHTSLTGDVLVGRPGIKPGTLKGRGFSGTQTVNGKIGHATRDDLPNFNTKLLSSQVQRYRNYKYINQNPDNFIAKESEINLDNKILYFKQDDLNEFKKSGIRKLFGPGVIILSGDIVMDEIELLGQIALVGDKGIAMYPPFTARDILVFANRISINGPVRISGQFFAEDAITISGKVNLTYPSIICLSSGQPWSEEKELILPSSTKINGAVILSNQVSADSRSYKKYNLIIEDDALVQGLTYSDRYSRLSGEIQGLLLTKQFYMYSKPTIYINWILDGILNREALSMDYRFPLGLGEYYDLDIAVEL